MEKMEKKPKPPRKIQTYVGSLEEAAASGKPLLADPDRTGIICEGFDPDKYEKMLREAVLTGAGHIGRLRPG